MSAVFLPCTILRSIILVNLPGIERIPCDEKSNKGSSAWVCHDLNSFAMDAAEQSISIFDNTSTRGRDFFMKDWDWFNWQWKSWVLVHLYCMMCHAVMMSDTTGNVREYMVCGDELKIWLPCCWPLNSGGSGIWDPGSAPGIFVARSPESPRSGFRLSNLWHCFRLIWTML